MSCSSTSSFLSINLTIKFDLLIDLIVAIEALAQMSGTACASLP
jgi:hypothetical protein